MREFERTPRRARRDVVIPATEADIRALKAAEEKRARRAARNLANVKPKQPVGEDA